MYNKPDPKFDYILNLGKVPSAKPNAKAHIGTFIASKTVIAENPLRRSLYQHSTQEKAQV